MRMVSRKRVLLLSGIIAVIAAIAVVGITLPRVTAQQAADTDWKAVEQALG